MGDDINGSCCWVATRIHRHWRNGMARVAFLGLGNMGLGMATRLLEAGHQLSVYNRTPSRTQILVGRGAEGFDTPSAACQGVDAVISMVADDAASRALWLGGDGALAA